MCPWWCIFIADVRAGVQYRRTGLRWIVTTHDPFEECRVSSEGVLRHRGHFQTLPPLPFALSFYLVCPNLASRPYSALAHFPLNFKTRFPHTLRAGLLLFLRLSCTWRKQQNQARDQRLELLQNNSMPGGAVGGKAVAVCPGFLCNKGSMQPAPADPSPAFTSVDHLP